MKPTIRVALSDDHPIVLSGLRELINSEPDMQVVCESRNGLQARAAILEHKPDVAVIDISMPGLNGIALTRQLAEEAPAVRAMLLTLHEDRTYLQEAFNAGARAYILKRSATECLISAIRSVATGAQYVDPALHLAVENTGVVSSAPLRDAALSHREADVLKQTALGLSLKEIASHLAIGIKTVETHKTRAMDKLGLTSRVELMRYAALHGWLSARTAG